MKNDIRILTASDRKQRVTWRARCKSGYEFNGHVCKRFAPRGALLCNDCLTAEVIPTVRAVGLFARAVGIVAALLS